MPTGAVVIPAYGKPELTQHVVSFCMAEQELIDVIVVDNAGDVADLPGATVLRPGTNLGWLRGTTLGFDYATKRDYSWIVGLNNDTRLSGRFFLGLRQALDSNPRALVAPCYNDSFSTQNDYYTGPADQFVGIDEDQPVQLIDGTCFALSSALYREVGELDGKHFGRRGWGAIEDYSIRVRLAGGSVMVTRRAYLEHDAGTTARQMMTTYDRYAAAEKRRGLRRKYGPQWRQQLPPLPATEDSLRGNTSDALRALEDRLGLSETWIGRRGTRSRIQ